MRVFVTGGAGFIGHHLVKTLLDDNHQVNILDIVSKENSRVKMLVKMGANYFEGDIRDVSVVASAGKGCTHVVHLAAQTSVAASFVDKAENHQINVNGTRNIIDFVNSNDIVKVLAASSAAVYGDCEQLPLGEEMAGNCLSPYAESKYQNETELLSLVNDKTSVSVLRFFNVYGQGQGIDSNYGAVIPSFIDKITSGLSPTIFGNGKQSRDFIEVSDVVGLIKQILLSEKQLSNDVYNVATQTETSIEQLLRIIANAASKSNTINAVPSAIYVDKRGGDITSSCANISKIKSAFDWEPKIALEQGISALVEHELKG